MEELKEENINVVYYDFFDHLKNNRLRQICVESWKRALPKANFICKTENTPEIAEFIKNDKWCQECLKHGNMKNYLVDTIRLWESLNIENYLYLDTDVYLLKSPMELLNKYDLFAGKQTGDLFRFCNFDKKIELFQNGTVMWSRKPNDIIKELLQFYNELPREECRNGNFNSYINYLFDLKNKKKLKDYALDFSESANYFYHFFLSVIERKTLMAFISEDKYEKIKEKRPTIYRLCVYNYNHKNEQEKIERSMGFCHLINNAYYLLPNEMNENDREEILDYLLKSHKYFVNLNKVNFVGL